MDSPGRESPEDRFTKAKVDVGCEAAIPRVLNAEPEHLFTPCPFRPARCRHYPSRPSALAIKARVSGLEHLAVRGAEEDRERRWPSAEQFQNPHLIAASCGGLRLRHAAQIDCARAASRASRSSSSRTCVRKQAAKRAH